MSINISCVFQLNCDAVSVRFTTPADVHLIARANVGLDDAGHVFGGIYDMTPEDADKVCRLKRCCFFFACRSVLAWRSGRCAIHASAHCFMNTFPIGPDVACFSQPSAFSSPSQSPEPLPTSTSTSLARFTTSIFGAGTFITWCGGS